ncbi:MAG: glycosyl transferase family 2 [Candidatus Hydrogenedentota bacterium]|nr:MAG: glycosyl transferase family 2 [Candidatus Hydrogenedentota bacterium]
MARVLVIIPAYNESESIADVLDALKRHAPDYDVLVVNDGSTDNTSAIVKRMGSADIIDLPFNMGIGSTMQTGYKYAVAQGYDIAVQCDADGQHPVEQLSRIVDGVVAKKADMIIGSRYVSDTAYTPSIFRRVGKSLLSRLVDSVVGGGITDTTSGFRAMNRAVFGTFARTYPDDYPEAEALVIMHRHGLKAVEVPVDMQPRQGGQSSIGPRRAAYYIVKVSMAIFIRMLKRITHAPDRGESDTAGSDLVEKTESR